MNFPSWHSDVVTTLWLTLSQRCGKVENESCGDVSFRRCDNVAKTLPQRCYNVATTSTNGCVGAFQLRIIDNSFPTSKHKRATKLYWGKSTLSLNRSFCLQLKKSISTHLPRNIKINMYIKHNQLHSFIYKQINCTLIQISLSLGVKLLAFM